MLLPRYIKILLIIITISPAFFKSADAGLHGFHQYNPYTKEERILDLSVVPDTIHNYRADMRNNLLMLIRYAKEQRPDFKIIAHEGQDLLTKSLWEYDREGYNRARLQDNAEDASFLFHSNFSEMEPERYTPAYDYLNSIDAIAINNLYCKPKKSKGRENNVTKNHNLGLITIEHCQSQEDIEDARINSMIDQKSSYFFTNISDAFNNTFDHNNINDSSKNIFNVSDAQNILIITDDSRYKNKEDFVTALLKTNYDIIIMKPLFANAIRFSADDIQKLRFKKNGTKRLLIAEFNVSEASPKDYYWNRDWKIGNPEWLARLSFSSKDTIITRFWYPEWKQIISRHFKDILEEGFDGIFFTGIENYQYFEQQTPLE